MKKVLVNFLIEGADVFGCNLDDGGERDEVFDLFSYRMTEGKRGLRTFIHEAY